MSTVKCNISGVEFDAKPTPDEICERMCFEIDKMAKLSLDEVNAPLRQCVETLIEAAKTYRDESK